MHALFPLKFGELGSWHARCIEIRVGIARYRVTPRDSPYVFLRFSVGRNAPTVFLNRAFTGVVSGQCEIYVSVKPIQEKAHVAGATFNILSGIENIRNAKTYGRSRH